MRPSILSHILAQKFTVLWSDSDVVWLDNPLPLLPDTRDPSDVRPGLDYARSCELLLCAVDFRLRLAQRLESNGMKVQCCSVVGFASSTRLVDGTINCGESQKAPFP